MHDRSGVSFVDAQISQSIINTVGFDVIVNNLKTTKAASVDRRVVFLQLIFRLIHDRLDLERA